MNKDPGINRQTIKIYWEHIKNHKTTFFLGFVFIPLAALMLDTLLPFFFSQVINGVSKSDQQIVIQNLKLAAAIGIFGVISNFIGFQSLVYHEASANTELANTTLDKLLKKDVRFFVNEKIGALTSRYIDFIRAHVAIQDLIILKTLGFVLSIVTGLVILASRSILLSVLVLVLIAALIIEVKWSINHRRKWRRARKKIGAEIHGNVADVLTNNIIVKTFAREKSELKRHKNLNKQFKEAFVNDIGFVTKEGSVRVSLMTIMQIVAIGIASHLAITHQIDVGIAIFALTYLQRLNSQIFELGGILNGYDQALLDAWPMTEILQKETTINDKSNAIVLKNINPTIKFNRVSYRYDNDGNDVLKNISLKIKSGEKIGLVGNSGAGKTTITQLLLRFYDVTDGSIEINGYDIRDVSQASLRENIAYVPQEPMLFHRTLRENIAYGLPKATDKQIMKAIEQANATDFINQIPEGLDAIVGERGIKLSGGQRQRVAIARAILKDAPILILDEATSALDSENERLIQDALSKLMKGRTSVVIAHRLSTIAKMDRILVLENGSIIEEGTHQELLKKNGTYAKLWSHQSGGFIEE